ncbi:MAG: flavin reductase family protein [Candidatus Omnitrophota bacterium]
MKIEVPKDRYLRLINSGNVVMVTSLYKDTANIITVTWQVPLSHRPPLVGISLANQHLSTELIRKSEEFVINVPDFSILDKVVHCGRVSGRDADKFTQAGLTPLRADKLTKAPLILECIGYLECYVRDTRPFGDHTLFVGEVIYAKAEEELFKDVWNTEKVKLIYHLGGSFFTGSKDFITR